PSNQAGAGRTRIRASASLRHDSGCAAPQFAARWRRQSARSRTVQGGTLAVTHLSPLEWPGGRYLGEGNPCYIVAEIGQNHNGCMATARQLIDAAADGRLDAGKFCKRDLASELTTEAFHQPYDNPHSYGPTYGEHRRALELSREQHAELSDYAAARGVTYFSTACDARSVEDLELIEVPFYK